MPTIHNVAQGSAEWHALRARYFTASEAAAMMGCNPYETRSALLRRKASGIAEEPDAARQRLFERGHEAEAAARPIAETIIGEELYPATMTAEIEGLPLLASLDGLTMDGSIAWEHKLMSERIIRALDETGEPPMDHVWQLEHQLLVSSAECVHYWCSDGGHDYRSVIYRSKPERRKALIEGWKQFQRDLQDPEATNFRPEPEPVQAKPVPGFGALVLRVEGRVVASNLDAFRAGADAFLARLPKPSDLKDDQDFADAEAAAKACSEAEARIKAAKEQAIAQMADVEAVLRTADTVSESIRQARLALEKAVKTRKEQIRADLVQQAVQRVRAHYQAIAADLGDYAPGIPASLTADLGAVIKGKKSLQSMADALDAEVARYKIDADELARFVRANMAVVSKAIEEHGNLWPDAPRLCRELSEEALRGIIAQRVAEHQERQRKRAEAQQQEIKGGGAGCAFVPGGGTAAPAGYTMAAAATSAANAGNGPLTRGAGSIPATPHLTIGQINAAIHPLRIDEAGLAELGIGMPVTRGGLERVIEALITHLTACMDAAVF